MKVGGGVHTGESAAPAVGLRQRTATSIRGAASRTFQSLEVRDFRTLWLGFMGSWVAMQMQQVARGYLAYQLSGNALGLGFVTLAMGLPRIVLSPYGGVLADRYSKRTVLLWTQAALSLFALAQALLLAAHMMTIEWLVVFGFFQGAAFSFNMPARQAYLPAIMGRGSGLANAIALNSAGMNLTRVAGPSVAGLLIALPFFGVEGAFFVVAACYVWVWWSVYRVENPGKPEGARRGAGRSIWDGFRYVMRQPGLFALMTLGFVPLAIGMPYISLMPVVAVHDLAVGPTGLGVLLSIAGVGSLVGTLMVAYLARYPHKARLQLAFGLVFGLSLLAFALSIRQGQFLATIPWLFVVGISGDAYMALNSSLIMLNTGPGVYGRVMGVYMTFQSIRPLSVLPISGLADAVGTSLTFILAGSVVAVFVLGVATLYPGYRRIGEGTDGLTEDATRCR